MDSGDTRGRVLNGLALPRIRAAIELGRNQPDRAIEALRPAAAFESATGQTTFMRALDKGANWSFGYAQAMVNLARASAQAGDTARAKRAYEDFIALWKDADADAPLLVAARKEYAALK